MKIEEPWLVLFLPDLLSTHRNFVSISMEMKEPWLVLFWRDMAESRFCATFQILDPREIALKQLAFIPDIQNEKLLNRETYYVCTVTEMSLQRIQHFFAR